MRPWVLSGILLLSVGCTQTAPPPAVPPPPDDLSSWAVPELIQPPAPVRPTLAVGDHKPTAAEKVYVWQPGEHYQVQAAVGAPLDVLLERGESLRNIVGGTRAPREEGQVPLLEVKEGSEGTGETLRPHVFIQASEPGLSAGFVVTTTRRSYLLTIKTVQQSPIRVVRWTYPPGTPAAQAPQEPGLLPTPWQPTRYHVGYAIEAQGPTPAWFPRGAWDDGKKLYLLYPDATLYSTVPLVRMIGPNGPQLVNARQIGTVVIIDQLAPRLELRVGTGERAETVTITRGALRTITCPEDTECPAWTRK